MTARALAALAPLWLASAGCGEEVAHGGAPRAPQPIVRRDLSPTEVLPRELDLVVRVDLGRLRQGLGPLAFEALGRQVPGDADVQRALGGADAVTVALRMEDLESGDRVVVVEGGPGARAETPASPGFQRVPSANDRVAVWDAERPAPRAGIARVVRLGDRAVAFVTPLYVDAVGRVLREGPEQARGQPFAEGLLSVDLRPRPLRPSLAARYPSIAAVLGGVARLRATANVAEGGLGLSAEIAAKDGEAAERVGRFLDLLRENAGERDPAGLRALEVDVEGATVHVRWTLPAEVILAALRDPAADEPATEGPGDAAP